jgi:intracellular septation protein
MKLLFDFLPIILFFTTFKFAEADKAWASAFATSHLGFVVSGGQVGEKEAPVLLATVVVIVATLAQVLFLKLRGRKIDTMLWVSLALVVVLGGLTIYFHSDTFIKWKPSVLYWVMGLSFWLSPILFGKNLLRMLLGEQFEMPAKVWRGLNFAWVVFFGLMGFLNIWVAYNYSLGTWVNFKLFGAMGLMLAFTVAQGLYLGRYIKGDKSAADSAGPAKPGHAKDTAALEKEAS